MSRPTLKGTLQEILSQFTYVDWGFENEMGMIQVSLSKDQLKRWCKTAEMDVPEQDADFYR